MMISLRKAADLTGRSAYTLRDWHYKFGMPIHRAGTFPDQWYVDTQDLKDWGNRLLDNFRNRPIRPGPGRGKHEPAGPLQHRTHKKEHTP